MNHVTTLVKEEKKVYIRDKISNELRVPCRGEEA